MTIAHRGPDGQGIWQDGEQAILGHRRLSILDVSVAATQPMHRQGRFHIVFNGEIYNFLEIRRELQSEGEVFSSESDTEVLIAAFVRWGEACLARLNGMWAFAIWDSVERRLFLARDRMGEKPLFYMHDGARFLFASEQKALLSFQNAVRPAAGFHALCRNPYAYEGTADTLFAGIARFPAAHCAWFSSGRLSIRRYWAPLEREPDLPRGYGAQVEALRALLLDSCRLRLRSDVPVATALSGGVDSSAVAASIAEIGRRRGIERLPANWQNAFVASFPGTVMDESEPARRIADHLGIRLREVPVVPQQAGRELERIAYLFEEVHEVNPLPHVALYREMRRDGMRVSLDGHGGDELFCGYESSVLHALPSAARRPRAAAAVLDIYRDVHPHSTQFRGMSLPRIALYLARAEVGERMRRIRSDAAMRRAAGRCDSLGRHLLGLSFATVLPTLLRNYDRYSMINGIEIRIPLLDHRIVDFAFALPWQSKLHNGLTKSVLREAVSPWLPAGIVANKTKIGFAPPIIDWMRGPLREYLLDELASRSFRHAGMVDPAALGKAMRDLILGDSDVILYDAERIWKEFAVYLWEKAFIQDQPWRHPAPAANALPAITVGDTE